MQGLAKFTHMVFYFIIYSKIAIINSESSDDDDSDEESSDDYISDDIKVTDFRAPASGYQRGMAYFLSHKSKYLLHEL